MQDELFTASQAQAIKQRARERAQEQAHRRRSDKLSASDQALRRKLEQGLWTREGLEWLRERDPALPLILMAIINAKLRELSQKTPLSGNAVSQGDY